VAYGGILVPGAGPIFFQRPVALWSAVIYYRFGLTAKRLFFSTARQNFKQVLSGGKNQCAPLP
jgi:hypothetical protein